MIAECLTRHLGLCLKHNETAYNPFEKSINTDTWQSYGRKHKSHAKSDNL